MTQTKSSSGHRQEGGAVDLLEQKYQEVVGIFKAQVGIKVYSKNVYTTAD